MRRVLIVEDDGPSRRALVYLFRLRGWKVYPTSTVGEALGLLDPPPDCILLDLMLPDGRGEAVIHKVQEGNLPTRVIVTTGCSDRTRLDDVRRLTPFTILRKPLDFCQIIVESS